MQAYPHLRSSDSGQRRRVIRVRTDLGVVLARANGEKEPARVLDVGVGGMHLQASRTPNYGEALTVIVQLDAGSDWTLLPATVRWFTSAGFGVEFMELTGPQAHALVAFIDRIAA